MTKRIGFGLLAALALGGCSGGDETKPDVDGGPTPTPDDVFVRVDQVGYLKNESILPVVMAKRSLKGTEVRARSGPLAALGKLDGNERAWNETFTFVTDVDIEPFEQRGDLVVTADGASATTRAGESGADLMAPLLANASFFYRAQRDGLLVDPTVLDRKPSHRLDEQASVYDQPVYKNDVLQTKLVPIDDRKVNVQGGWFDAGDYLKFVETASYTAALMLIAQRDAPGPMARAKLDAEAAFGLAWLHEMWDFEHQTLYYQVGIGDGNRDFAGDHDLWRLPEDDDGLKVAPGSYKYFVAHRPVFRAGPPGSKISPNLAGRLAAAFALAAQVEKDEGAAGAWLIHATEVFGLADFDPKGPLLTASPHDYYPETEWRDDIELGATEIVLAARAHPGVVLPQPVSDYLVTAGHHARQYIDEASGSDTLNLYDVSALAHRELARALEEPGSADGLEVTRRELVADIESQLRGALDQAKKDPFGLGIGYGDGDDATPHALGLAVMAAYHRELDPNQDPDLAELGTRQRHWALGTNAWGSSFVIGAGTTSPACPQHQIANLIGKPLLGGVVDGPSAAGDFQDLGLPDGATRCPKHGGDALRAFDGKGARYVDDVVAWPSVEPSIDYTAISVLLFAIEAAK